MFYPTPASKPLRNAMKVAVIELTWINATRPNYTNTGPLDIYHP